MRIAPSERVVYENNPLAEVVCQIRFERATMSDEALAAFRNFAEPRYPNVFAEETAEVSMRLSVGGDHKEVIKQAKDRIHHFATADQSARVSISSEFVAVTCNRYESWSAFKPQILDAAKAFVDCHGAPRSTRVGLRYKDVIEREPLGLAEVPWRDLLAPFVLGPLAPSTLTAEGVPPETDILSFAFQSNIRLDDCKLLLQGGLLFSAERERHAYLVDSDFFLDDAAPAGLLSELGQLDEVLERLHANAGALFSRTIQPRLHDGLKPRR